MYFPSSRCAVTTFLHSLPLELPDSSAKQSHGLLKGYIVAVIARGAFHALGGYLYWMSYMPDNFPKSLTAIYPIVYNYSYLLAEGIITVIVISIPAVSKALVQVKKAALGTSL